MKTVAIFSILLASALFLAGCQGVPTSGEQQARHDLNAVTRQLPPHPALPALTPDSGLSNYLAFALLNSPSVQAAFYDWSASVENITVTRSLPDPQLTLQAYITHTLTSLMPGFAWSVPGPGKLAVRARVATAASEGKYFTFQTAVLQAAFDLKKAYLNLALLEEQLRLKRESVALLDNLDRAIRAQTETSPGTLANVIRVQSGCDRLRSELESLADSRHPLVENFKAALGLAPQQPDPPLPAHFEISRDDTNMDELLRAAFARNPQLKAMEAEVRGAEAGIAAAYKERTPDFNASLSAEVYAPPFSWPQAGMTLPIWRDKLAAEIAQAKASDLAANTRLQAAQINLAVNLAEKSFACRETARTVTLIEDHLLPQARQSLETVRSGYRVGAGDFASLTDAERAPLDLELAAAQARTDHEIALAEFSILIAGVPPAGAPSLSRNP